MEQLAKRLKFRLGLPLPGSAAQILMAHEERKLFFNSNAVPQNARTSSVLILIYQDSNKFYVPLIVRQQDGHVHSGQVSFPGGKQDPSDADLSITALREAEEEIGVSRHDIQLVGRLSEFYIPPSNFMVHPFVGIHSGVPEFTPDSREVERVVPIRLDHLMDDQYIAKREIPLRNGFKITVPAFCMEGLVVWGATAMILSELRVLLTELDG
ncbi:MAG: NUDIX hydrolase [Bacteroidota bacterium]